MAELIVVGKVCRTCKVTKPLDEFHRSRNRKDGHKADCRDCRNLAYSRYAISERGRAASLARMHKHMKTAKYRAGRNHYKRTKQHRTIKYSAQRRIKHAVASGYIPPARSLPCAHCGGKAYGYHHHLGYEREHHLDVIPLCPRCHVRADRGLPKCLRLAAPT